MDAHDQILIRGLELPVHLGVSDAERAAPQVVMADVIIEMRRGFDAMPDALEGTMDYETLANQIKALAASRPRRLLETLAAEIVAAVMRHEEAAAAEVELRKRILPGADHVAVRLRRARG